MIALIKVNKSYSLLLLPFGRNNCMNEKEGRDGWKGIFILRGIGKNGKLEKRLKFDVDLMEKKQPFISKKGRNKKK